MAVIDEEKRKVAQPGLGMPARGQTISQYGTPKPMTPQATQAAVNQSAMYVEGAKAAAAQRPPVASPPSQPAPVAAPMAGTMAGFEQIEVPAGVAPLAKPPAQPLDAQAGSDRAAIAGGVDSLMKTSERAGAAIADVGLMIPRGVAGAYDSTVVRGMRAAGINAGYVSPLLNPASAPGSTSMTPYYDEIRARDAAAQTPAPVAPPAAAPAPTVPAPAAPPTPAPQKAAGQPGGMPSPAAGGVAPAGGEQPGLGMVNVRRQPNGVMEFSGENVSGPVSYQGAQAAGFKPSGAGVSVVPGMAPGEARAILDRPFDPRNGMSAEQRYTYDKQVKEAQGINNFNAGMNPRKTTIDDLLRSRLANSASRRQATADQTEIARGTADLGARRQAESEQNSQVQRDERTSNMAESQQLQTARSTYLAADTDEKRAAAAKTLMALQGKTEASPGYTVVPGEEYLAPDGLTKLRGPALVLDNRTGKVVDMNQQGRRGEAPGAKGARPESYEVGKTYTVGDRKVRVVGLDAQGQPQFQEAK